MKLIPLEALRVNVDHDMLEAFDRVFPMLERSEESYLIRSAPTCVFEAGEVIVEEGRAWGSIHIVDTGIIRVETARRKGEGEGGAVEVARLGRASVFGELSFVDDQPASATIVAETEVRTLMVGSDILHALMRGDPGFGSRFYHSLAMTLAMRLRRTTRLHVDMVPRAAQDRRHGERRQGGVEWQGAERRLGVRRMNRDRRHVDEGEET